MFWSHLPTVRDGNVNITPQREDRPEFKRVYQVAVGDGFKVEITMRTYSFGRCDWSQLTQKNGKWILFDAKAVADKILDRELYPLVQAAVDQILALDRAYIATDPGEFIDDTGATWRRV
jgi:hypothetical protein